MWRQWCEDIQVLLADLPAALPSHQPAQALTLRFERWLMLLKALRRMALFGFASDAKSLQQVPIMPQVTLPGKHNINLCAFLPCKP